MDRGTEARKIVAHEPFESARDNQRIARDRQLLGKWDEEVAPITLRQDVGPSKLIADNLKFHRPRRRTTSVTTPSADPSSVTTLAPTTSRSEGGLLTASPTSVLPYP